jgi:transcriptional regulator with XRE-family HTH domain
MNNPVDVAVGKRIRQLRKERRITQSELAKSIGLTFQQIQKYEKARNRISASKLVEIADIFDVEVAELFLPVQSQEEKTLATEDERAQLIQSVQSMDAEVRAHFLALVSAIANRG